MILVALGRFIRRCIDAAQRQDAEMGYSLENSDFMTDAELSDCMHGRGHLVDWNEIHRRRNAMEIQTPWGRNAIGGKSA